MVRELFNTTLLKMSLIMLGGVRVMDSIFSFKVLMVSPPQTSNVMVLPFGVFTNTSKSSVAVVSCSDSSLVMPATSVCSPTGSATVASVDEPPAPPAPPPVPGDWSSPLWEPSSEPSSPSVAASLPSLLVVSCP